MDENRFQARAGLFFTGMTTRVRVDSERLGVGTELKLEDDLGLPSGRTVPGGEIAWRFAPRWVVGFEYFGVDRARTVSIEREIRFGEERFEAGAEVEGRFRSDLYRVQVGWLPLLSEDGYLGLMVGLHLTDFLLGVAGEVQVTDEGSHFRADQREVLAPLPNVGVFGRERLAGPFSAVGRVNWFSLKVDDLKGGITDAEACLHWQATRPIGIGVGYRHLDYRLDIDRSYTGRVRYTFDGPVVFATASF